MIVSAPLSDTFRAGVLRYGHRYATALRAGFAALPAGGNAAPVAW